MFSLIAIDTTVDVKIQCNVLMQNYNLALQQTINTFRFEWQLFWDNGRSVEEMQAILDTLTTTPTTDLGQPLDSLSAYFNKAVRLITFILNENSQAFADALTDTVSGNQPNGEPYVQFLTPGWIYTVDPSNGRLIVSAPCVFTPPPRE